MGWGRLFTALVVLVLLLLPGAALGASTMEPIPDTVGPDHSACREIMRLAKKYEAEDVFPREFEEGHGSCSRLEVARALHLVTEKMAERAVEDGSSAVSKEDLKMLALLRAELGGELALVTTRTFQLRNELLGLRLHPLTRNITISGGMTGVLQQSFGNEPRDHLDAVGRGDILFEFRVGRNTIAVMDLEATGGNGLDEQIDSFSQLNGLAGSTNDRVRFREAWVEHTAFDGRFQVRVGKLDLFFDQNAIANDENSQFLSGAFINSVVLGAPLTGPGIRAQGRVTERLTICAGYGSGDGTTRDLTDHGFGFVEADFRGTLRGREGNYRIYGIADGSRPSEDSAKIAPGTGFGYGVSVDQQVTAKLSLFGRYGRRDEDRYSTVAAWSAGFQYAGNWFRLNDILAFAFGQVLGNGVAAQEKLAETYYRITLNEHMAMSAHFQYLMDAGGDIAKKDIAVAGLRTQIIF